MVIMVATIIIVFMIMVVIVVMAVMIVRGGHAEVRFVHAVTASGSVKCLPAV